MRDLEVLPIEGLFAASKMVDRSIMLCFSCTLLKKRTTLHSIIPHLSETYSTFKLEKKY